MADKDPKDMTASELLREAVAVSESATGYWTPIGELFLLLDTCFSDGQEDLFRALADKIDAELAQARRSELVRCRDCIYWRDEDFCANPQWQTGRPSNGLIAFPCTFPESFCSYAEKREGDE